MANFFSAFVSKAHPGSLPHTSQRNKLAKSGAKLVHIGMPIVCKGPYKDASLDFIWPNGFWGEA